MTPNELEESLNRKKGSFVHSESVRLLADALKKVWETHYRSVSNNAFTYMEEDD